MKNSEYRCIFGRKGRLFLQLQKKTKQELMPSDSVASDFPSPIKERHEK